MITFLLRRAREKACAQRADGWQQEKEEATSSSNSSGTVCAGTARRWIIRTCTGNGEDFISACAKVTRMTFRATADWMMKVGSVAVTPIQARIINILACTYSFIWETSCLTRVLAELSEKRRLTFALQLERITLLTVATGPEIRIC